LDDAVHEVCAAAGLRMDTSDPYFQPSCVTRVIDQNARTLAETDQGDLADRSWLQKTNEALAEVRDKRLRILTGGKRLRILR
jgi:hypothetical protein